MVSSSQIKEQLARFLDRQIGLDAFEDWFVQNTWNIHLSGSVAAESLTFAIEESLSEYSSGHIDSNNLHAELAQILHADTSVVNIAEAPQIMLVFKSASPTRLVALKL
jgi:hypothetical protein